MFSIDQKNVAALKAIADNLEKINSPIELIDDIIADAIVYIESFIKSGCTLDYKTVFDEFFKRQQQKLTIIEKILIKDETEINKQLNKGIENFENQIRELTEELSKIEPEEKTLIDKKARELEGAQSSLRKYKQLAVMIVDAEVDKAQLIKTLKHAKEQMNEASNQISTIEEQRKQYLKEIRNLYLSAEHSTGYVPIEIAGHVITAYAFFKNKITKSNKPAAKEMLEKLNFLSEIKYGCRHNLLEKNLANAINILEKYSRNEMLKGSTSKQINKFKQELTRYKRHLTKFNEVCYPKPLEAESVIMPKDKQKKIIYSEKFIQQDEMLGVIKDTFKLIYDKKSPRIDNSYGENFQKIYDDLLQASSDIFFTPDELNHSENSGDFIKTYKTRKEKVSREFYKLKFITPYRATVLITHLENFNHHYNACLQNAAPSVLKKIVRGVLKVASLGFYSAFEDEFNNFVTANDFKKALDDKMQLIRKTQLTSISFIASTLAPTRTCEGLRYSLEQAAQDKATQAQVPEQNKSFVKPTSFVSTSPIEYERYGLYIR